MRDDLERLPGLMSELKESSNSPSILPENVRDYVEVRCQGNLMNSSLI